MKNSVIKVTIALFLLTGFLTFSCNKDEDNSKMTTINDITKFKLTKNTPNHIIAEYITDRVNFTYEAITDGTITTSTLNVNYKGVIS